MVAVPGAQPNTQSHASASRTFAFKMLLQSNLGRAFKAVYAQQAALGLARLLPDLKAVASLRPLAPAHLQLVQAAALARTLEVCVRVMP